MTLSKFNNVWTNGSGDVYQGTGNWKLVCQTAWQGSGHRVNCSLHHLVNSPGIISPVNKRFPISFNDRLIISQLVVPASLFCTLKLLGLQSDTINYTPAAIIPIKIVPARDPKQRGRNLKRSCIIMLVRMLMLLIMLKKILMMMMMRMRGRLWCGCWGGGGGRRRWWCWGGWRWGGRPIPRPGSTLCASLRSPNLHGHFTRAIVCGNWQGKCRTPSPRHPLCGSLRSRNACQKKHFVQKFAVKMPDASPAASVLCEPAQSKCTWTCHRRHFVWKLTENAKRPGYHLDWTPGLNTYRKNPSVWTHCLGPGESSPNPGFGFPDFWRNWNCQLPVSLRGLSSCRCSLVPGGSVVQRCSNTGPWMGQRREPFPGSSAWQRPPPPSATAAAPAPAPPPTTKVTTIYFNPFNCPRVMGSDFLINYMFPRACRCTVNRSWDPWVL